MSRNRKLVIAAVVVLTAAVIGVIVGVAKAGGSKEEPAKSTSSNSMTCNSNNATAMEGGFSMMPMNSMNMTSDMMTMGSMEFNCMADHMVYTKMSSETRTMENGDTETVWVGAMLEDGQMGFATVVQTQDGMAGSFTTNSGAFSLMEAPDGAMMMKMRLWTDMPDGADPENEDSTMVSNVTVTMEAVNTPTAMNGIVQSDDFDQVSSAVVGTSRRLRESRQLQASTIRVLLVVTNRAMCENSGLAAGCALTTATQAAFTRRVPILVSQTNNAMQGVQVSAQIQIVNTIFLAAGFDPNPDGAALNVIRTNANFATWRRENSADLVALITGRDTAGRLCGIGNINSFSTATGQDCLDNLTFTHELGHNMGALHDRENSRDQTEFAHGYRQLSGSNRFRTVMSYNNGCNCQVIPYFSANGFTLRGQAIGTPTHDNARQLKLTAAQTAAFV